MSEYSAGMTGIKTAMEEYLGRESAQKGRGQCRGETQFPADERSAVCFESGRPSYEVPRSALSKEKSLRKYRRMER